MFNWLPHVLSITLQFASNYSNIVQNSKTIVIKEKIMDGAVFSAQKAIRVDVMIRDDMRRVSATLSKKIHSPLGALGAEAKAFETGVSFALGVEAKAFGG